MQDGSTIGDGTIVETRDKIVTDRAGEEEWMREWKVKRRLVDKYKSVTSALDSVKLSTVRRKIVKGKESRLKRRHQGTWDPRIPPSTHAKMGRQYNYFRTGKQTQSKFAVMAFFLDLKFTRGSLRIIIGFGFSGRCNVKQGREGERLQGAIACRAARYYSMPYHTIIDCSITSCNMT